MKFKSYNDFSTTWMYVAGNIICFRKACSYEVTTILRMLRFDMLPAVSELSLPLLSSNQVGSSPSSSFVPWSPSNSFPFSWAVEVVNSTQHEINNDNHIKNLFAYSMIEQAQSFKSIIVPLTVSVKFKPQNFSFRISISVSTSSSPRASWV